MICSSLLARLATPLSGSGSTRVNRRASGSLRFCGSESHLVSGQFIGSLDGNSSIWVNLCDGNGSTELRGSLRSLLLISSLKSVSSKISTGPVAFVIKKRILVAEKVMHIACDILAKSHHRKSIHITFFMYKTYGDQRKYCYCFSSVPFFHVPIILPLFCFYFSFLWAQPQINRFFFLTPLLSSSFKLLFFLGLKVYTCLSCLYGPRQPALDSWIPPGLRGLSLIPPGLRGLSLEKFQVDTTWFKRVIPQWGKLKFSWKFLWRNLNFETWLGPGSRKASISHNEESCQVQFFFFADT